MIPGGTNGSGHEGSAPDERVVCAPTPDAPGTSAPPSAGTSRSTDRLLAFAAWSYAGLSRPRVRLTVIGIVLMLIGGLFMANSVWTLPLVIVGSLMVVIAWIGRRLDGRLAVQWGETGTQFEFRAEIKAARPARPAASSSHELVRTPERGPVAAGTIDGEAHTVEIEVAELEALIAAVETREAELALKRK